jgi:hypothetical protein
MIPTPHIEQHIVGDRLPGLLDPPFANEDIARQYQSLRPRAAFCEAKIDKALVGTETFHHGPLPLKVRLGASQK